MKLLERFPDLAGREVTAVTDDESGLGILLDGGWSIGVVNAYTCDIPSTKLGLV